MKRFDLVSKHTSSQLTGSIYRVTTLDLPYLQMLTTTQPSIRRNFGPVGVLHRFTTEEEVLKRSWEIMVSVSIILKACSTCDLTFSFSDSYWGVHGGKDYLHSLMGIEQCGTRVRKAFRLWPFFRNFIKLYGYENLWVYDFFTSNDLIIRVWLPRKQ